MRTKNKPTVSQHTVEAKPEFDIEAILAARDAESNTPPPTTSLADLFETTTATPPDFYNTTTTTTTSTTTTLAPWEIAFGKADGTTTTTSTTLNPKARFVEHCVGFISAFSPMLCGD